MSRQHHLPRTVFEWKPDSERVKWVLALVIQTLAIVAYYVTTPAEAGTIRYLIYPFVWINVSAWAVLHASSNPGSRAHRAVALLVSVAYLAAMLYVAGFVGHGHEAMAGWRFIQAPPGWGPMVAYQGHWLRLYLVPFQVIGYVALAYLLYVALLDATRAALSGVFGLVSCVGCTWTLVTPLVVSVFGSTPAVGTTLYMWTYDLTTGVFLLTVVLLSRLTSSSR